MQYNFCYSVLKLVVLVFVVSACGPAKQAVAPSPTSEAPAAPTPTELIAEAVLNFDNQTEFAIAMIQDGKVTYNGVKVVNDSLQYIDNQGAVFEIGSLTKVFTSTLLAQAVNKGELKLTDTINPYFPFEFHNKEQLQFLNLANHTARLPRLPHNYYFLNFKNPYAKYGEAELTEYLQNHIQLYNPSDEDYVYSNLGAGLLAYALQKKYNQTYEALLQSGIFKKYGMTNTTTIPSTLQSTLVQGLDYEGKPTDNWDFNVLAGAGAIYSNVEDLSKFVLAQMDASELDLVLTHKVTYTISDKMSIGLGWHTLKKAAGGIVYWHNGATGGYSSITVFDKENNTAAIILTNVAGLHRNQSKVDALGFAIMKCLRDSTASE